jgi:hypothetical protein
MVEILAPANLHEGYLLDAVYNGISFPVIVVSDSRYIHVAHSLTTPSHLPSSKINVNISHSKYDPIHP